MKMAHYTRCTTTFSELNQTISRSTPTLKEMYLTCVLYQYIIQFAEMSTPTASNMMGPTLPESPPQIAYSVHHPNMNSPGFEHLDEDHLQTVYKFLKDMKFGVEEDLDLTQIHLRPVFKPASVLGITLLFYGALILVGIVVNAVISAVITRRKLYLTDNTHLCVLNLSVAFLMQLIVVVPLTLFVIVVHNWVLGSFICYTLPIIQVS